MIGSLEYGGSQAMIINLYKAIDRDKIQFDLLWINLKMMPCYRL